MKKHINWIGKTLAATALTLGATAPASRAEFVTQNTDFADLFNKYRVAQPNPLPWSGSYWPFSYNGTAVKVNGKSPAEKHDRFFGLSQGAAAWERDNHTCKKGTPTYDDCTGWWGHCNGWTAAALMEPEPRSEIERKIPGSSKKMKFGVADQKAYLSEIWLDVWATYSGWGTTAKPDDWILDEDKPVAKQSNSSGISNYESYWDVTPRMLFLVLTNQVGVLKQGVALDRYTGEQIWNQPLSGYRILPIRQQDIGEPEKENGKTLYPIRLRTKLYWADDGVAFDNVALGFDVNKTSDSELSQNENDGSIDGIPEDYKGRQLAFTLFLDAPIEIADGGTRIAKAGEIVGDGFWDHQMNPDAYYGPEGSRSYDVQLHPDFLWRPDHLIDPFQRNPNYDAPKLYEQILGKKLEEPPTADSQ